MGSSRTRDRTCVPCIGRQIPNHWNVRETPIHVFFFFNELLLSTYYVSRPVLGIEGKRWTTQSSTGAALREWVCICTISPGGFWELGKAFYLDECNMSTSGWQIYYWRQNILSCKDLWMFSKQEAFSPNWTEFSSVQLLSPVRLFATPWIAACQASLSITNSRSPPKPMSIESVMPPSHLILCHLLLLLPPVLPSIRVFSHESTLHMGWPKCWSFSFNISPSNEHPGLISFRMDWLDLLAVQGTLKSLLQHHSSKASILQHSAFFTVQLSYSYMTTGKTTALTRWTFVGKVMSLLFNMLSRLVITFLPRSKRLKFHGYSHHLQWLWSPKI